MGFVISPDQGERLAQLCREYRVRTLKLFGSATTDEFRDDSDLDFLVEFFPPPPGMRPSTQFFGLRDQLQELFARHVDLLETVAIQNSVLRQSALESSLVLYAA